MNKQTMNNKISNDDYLYAKDLIDYYTYGKINFYELLEVLPSSINLAKLIKIAKFGFHDQSISKKLATLIIEHYYNKLQTTKPYSNTENFKNSLTVKEVLFLTDSNEIEKLLDGKEIDLGEEIRTALYQIENQIEPLLTQKVLGNSRSKLVVMIKPYNSMFKKEKYLSYTPGFISPEGNISFVSEEMINQVESLQSELDLFPARIPTERYLFELCKKIANQTSEPNL